MSSCLCPYQRTLDAVKLDEGYANTSPAQTHRELRFLSFASVDFDGNVYMTPQDFLDSVTNEIPKGHRSIFKALDLSIASDLTV
ncbi:DgyrCDS3317 [Dimorphilus gyrociliatus]|uniref:DgyrCDS3317 n=1 Tax=Dimorphilus gyrociliatus TaxID=2664684 RepID=A0A7I8VFW3_9ANNE|nr:DgyrCDS3317 [Dimorphilus gyrociliatus]